MAKKTAKKTVKKATSARKPAKPAAKKTVKSAKKVVTKATPKAAKAPARKAGKPHLTKAQTEKYRQILLEKRRALIGDMSGIEAETLGSNRHNAGGDLSNMPTHPADLGTDNYEHEFSLGLLESERAMLNEIDEALARINDRTFGVCLGTGEPIGKARLQARPWSKYCIEYARMIEQGLVRPGQEDEELED